MSWFEKFILLLVTYSVGMFFVELSFGAEHSLAGPAFFLWSERVVALILTVELIYDFFRVHKYHRTAEFYIDLVAVLPFWIGFFVPVSLLPTIRALRILRLLKFYVASPTAQRVVRNLSAQSQKLRVVSAFAGIIILFAGTAMHLIEGPTQPETFGSFWSSIWWAVTTATTVGYGDMSPSSVPGQVVACLIMITSIGIVGALISIVGNAFDFEDPQ